MKKSIFFAAMLCIASVFVGCKDNGTPETDSTKLWPAGTSDGKWGYIDAKGKMAINAMYDDVSSFSCGYALVASGTNEYFIDTKGKMQTATFDGADDFYYSYSTIYLNDRMGLMNTKFDFTIQPMYYALGTMSKEGLISAKMSSDAKYGYLNAKGDNKISAMYDYADDFKDGIAIVSNGSKYGAINAKGDYIIQPMYDGLVNMGGGLVAFSQNDKVGAMNAKGDIVIPAMYDNFRYCYDNGLIPVKQGDKWGYMDKKGNIKISCIYDGASSFLEGYAAVSMNEAIQIIDTKGKTVLTLAKNEDIESLFHNGLALVSVTNEKDYSTSYKYIDINGKIVYSWAPKSDNDYDYAPARKAAAKESVDPAEMALHFDSRKL